MMRIVWMIAKAIGVLLLIAVIGAGGWIAANWTFVNNFLGFRDVGPMDVDWYRPLQPVPGADAPRALPRAEAPSISAAALAAAQAYSEEMGGLGLIVFHDGAVQHESYAQGFAADKRSATYSMHKSVLGLVYMAALADGIIGSLDDPTGDYIEAWADDARGEIPLRDFLQMTSGIRLYSLGKGEMRAMKLVLSDKVSGTALKSPILRPSGTAFSYNNASSQIAGEALRQALARRGLTYSEYLSQRIWAPIGNETGYLWLAREGGEPRFFSGLHATLSDWLRVGLLIAKDGRGPDGAVIIPEALMETYRTPGPLNPQYGIQVWLGSPWTAKRLYQPDGEAGALHSEPYRVDDIVLFDGFGGQRVYVSRSLGLVVARAGLVRVDYDDARIVNLLIDGILKDEAEGEVEGSVEIGADAEDLEPAAESEPAL